MDALSTQPAKLFGLYPRKGAIEVGRDADIVVYDPEYRGTISALTQLTNNDYSGFEGWEIEGRPAVVMVRGKVQVRDGEFVGEQGRGRCCSAKPQYVRSEMHGVSADAELAIELLKELRTLTADDAMARSAWRGLRCG